MNVLESDFVEIWQSDYVPRRYSIYEYTKEWNRVDEDGFYELPLLFKTELPMLPDNRYMAERRPEQLKRWLSKNSSLYDDYNASMEWMNS